VPWVARPRPAAIAKDCASTERGSPPKVSSHQPSLGSPDSILASAEGIAQISQPTPSSGPLRGMRFAIRFTRARRRFHHASVEGCAAFPMRRYQLPIHSKLDMPMPPRRSTDVVRTFHQITPGCPAPKYGVVGSAPLLTSVQPAHGSVMLPSGRLPRRRGRGPLGWCQRQYLPFGTAASDLHAIHLPGPFDTTNATSGSAPRDSAIPTASTLSMYSGSQGISFVCPTSFCR